MKTRRFKVGDVVNVADNGGSPMTVAAIEEKNDLTFYRCQWFNGTKAYEALFLGSSLYFLG